MSRVALVFPYFRTRSVTEMLFPPLGVAALAGQLRALDVETRVFDGTFSTLEQLSDDLNAYSPDIVGVSSMVSLTGNTLRIAEMVKTDLPDSLIVAGGPLPTVFPARYRSHFDAVFRGEADVSFPRFCRDYFGRGASRLALGGLPLDSYDGLFITDHGLRVDNPTVHHLESELETFALPDRSDFDHAAYQREWQEKSGVKATSIMTSLGCPFSCDFCSRPIFGAAVRRRSLDAVFAEIDQIVADGYDSLWIADDIFTLSLPYLEEFCRRMTSRQSATGRQMTWSCLSRATGLDIATVRRMKAAGCRRVYLGLESASQATLDLMKKGVTVEQGVRAAHLYRDAGVEVAAFFIVGYPGETVASIEETFALALALPLDEISFNVPMPLPGSGLFERLNGRDEEKDWSGENEVTFVYPSEFDEDWLRARIDETMNAFARRARATPAL